MARFTTFCTIIAMIFFVLCGIIFANGAPQEAAASAMALTGAVLPYILFRIGWCEKTLENQQKIIELLKKDNS